MRLLLIGNYGAGNMGDEALREYFVHSFPEIHWDILSAKPSDGELPRLPFGLRSALRTPWWRTLDALRHCDGVVFGGGSLFTDIESTKACMLWWMHVKIAVVFRKPIYLAFQGIGPFKTRFGRLLTRSALRSAAFISVRDQMSRERVRKFGVATGVIQSFDPVYSSLTRQKSGDRTQKMLIIIPRNNSPKSFLEVVIQHARSLDVDCVRILSLQPHNPEERRVCAHITSWMTVPVEILPIYTVDDLGEAIAPGSLVLAQRYHGALAALALGIPVEIFPQGEGDKLSTLRDLIHAQPSLLHELVSRGEQELRNAFRKNARTSGG